MRYALILILAAVAACSPMSTTEAQLTGFKYGLQDAVALVDGADVLADDIDSDQPETSDLDVSIDVLGDTGGTTDEVADADVDLVSEEVAEDILDVEDVEDIEVADSVTDADVSVEDIADITDIDESDVDILYDDVPEVTDPSEVAIVEDVPIIDIPDSEVPDVVDPVDVAQDVAVDEVLDVPLPPEDIPVITDDIMEDVPVMDNDVGGIVDVIDLPDTSGEDIPTVDPCLGVLCDQSDPCIKETCDPATGKCVAKSVELQENVPCEDGDFCTVGDVCAAGVCLSGAVDPLVCQCVTAADCAQLEDATLCTKPVTCVANVCKLGALVSCGDGNPCSYDVCVDATGLCSFPVVPACCLQDEECEDNNGCTSDWCELKPGLDQNTCFHKNLDIACSDGDACTVGDHCDLNTGACTPGDVATCDDNDPCTFGDFCIGGTCVGKNLDCSDNDPCTQNEACVAGECAVPDPTNCVDTDPCSYDDCDASQGCTHTLLAPQSDSESPGKAGDASAFQAWFIPDAGWHVGYWCSTSSSCEKQIGIKLSDTSKVRIQMSAASASNQYGGVSTQPYELEFGVQHHFDIVGSAFPTVEVWQNGVKLAEHVFKGPSERHYYHAISGAPKADEELPIDVDSVGDIEIRFKRNGAKVSTSPTFEEDIHFLGEIVIHDACH